MLKIHEVTDARGELYGIYLDYDGDSQSPLVLVDAEGSWPLPLAALERVLSRYGAPFDPDARVTRLDSLALGGGKRLQHVRHLAGYDVVQRDYLVLELGDDGEPHCAHGATVAAALQHLARAFVDARQKKGPEAEVG